MVEINIEYSGDLRCRSTHGPSGCELITDAPVDNHGKGESFSPTDLVATALGSCVATIMGIYAQRNDFDLVGVKIHVEKHMSQDAPVASLDYRSPFRCLLVWTKNIERHWRKQPATAQSTKAYIPISIHR